jgi:hypothetical protein
MGTIVSTSSSFAQNVSVSLDIKAFGIGFGANAGFTDTSTDSNSETITKETSLLFDPFYGGSDGFDHTND